MSQFHRDAWSTAQAGDALNKPYTTMDIHVTTPVVAAPDSTPLQPHRWNTTEQIDAFMANCCQETNLDMRDLTDHTKQTILAMHADVDFGQRVRLIFDALPPLVPAKV